MEEKKEKQGSAGKFPPILWLLGYLLIVAALFAGIIMTVYDVDPYFHYHAPDTDKYYYELTDERLQNDGILKTFEYDAIVTGATMSENFKTSEVDELFGVKSVKTTFSDASFKEVGDYLKTALAANPDVKLVIRSLDMNHFIEDADDMGDAYITEYSYLYDDTLINDYPYLLNRDLLFGSVLPMKLNESVKTGVSDFDSYANWMESAWGYFGKESVWPEDFENYDLYPVVLSDYDKIEIRENVQKNIIDIAEAYPDVQFYCYVAPYSVAWWNVMLYNGAMIRQIQSEQYVIELLLGYDNIHLYSFNDYYDVTMNLNNYVNIGYCGEWINSAMLRWMKDGEGLLTEENYLGYIQDEYNAYSTLDYTLLNDQVDYEDDKAFAEEFTEYLFSPKQEDTEDTEQDTEQETPQE